jgi:uncharacterized protein (DUF1499 family)
LDRSSDVTQRDSGPKGPALRATAAPTPEEHGRAPVLPAAASEPSTFGPAAVWTRLFGPADLGPADIATLGRRPSNDGLIAPPGLSAARPDAVAPVFAVAVPRLAAALDGIMADEPRTIAVARDADGQGVRWVARTRFFRFPDTIEVRYTRLGPDSATLSLYSRSQVGVYDWGVNRRRLLRILGQLEAIVPTAAKATGPRTAGAEKPA